MQSIDPFVNPHGWRITSWEVQTNGGNAGSIPSNGFFVGGTMIIGKTHHGTESCSLSWLDGRGRLCSILDLHFNADTGVLRRDQVVVSFGEENADCSVSISFDKENGIQATMQEMVQDGNTGTFKAEAVPPPDPV